MLNYRDPLQRTRWGSDTFNVYINKGIYNAEREGEVLPLMSTNE